MQLRSDANGDTLESSTDDGIGMSSPTHHIVPPPPPKGASSGDPDASGTDATAAAVAIAAESPSASPDDRPWHKPELAREAAEKLLTRKPVGAFVIRASSSPKDVAITLRIIADPAPKGADPAPKGLLHVLIELVDSGPATKFRLRAPEAKVFDTVDELVMFYAKTVVENHLPVQLVLDGCLGTDGGGDSDSGDDEAPAEGDYASDDETLHVVADWVRTSPRRWRAYLGRPRLTMVVVADTDTHLSTGFCGLTGHLHRC